MVLWVDLTNSLVQNDAGFNAFVQTELELARSLYNKKATVKFSVVSQFGFKEVPVKRLKWLFNTKNLAESYSFYLLQKKSFKNKFFSKLSYKIEKKIYKLKRRRRDKKINKSDFIIHPYKNGDVIFSDGCYGTLKEDFFQKVKRDLPDLQLVYKINNLAPIDEDVRHFYCAEDNVFANYLKWISDNCDKVVYGSKTAQSETEKYFKERMLKTPIGSSFNLLRYAETDNEGNDFIDSKYGIKNYVLLIGSFHPKNNFRVLYQALSLLKVGKDNANLHLVIVEKELVKNDLRYAIQTNPLVKDNVTLVRCTSKELVTLIKNAKFLCVPSLCIDNYTDFCAALNLGKFCICSDNSFLKEIGGDFVEYVHPKHPQEWADKMDFYMHNTEELCQKEQYIKKNYNSEIVKKKEEISNLYNFLIQPIAKISLKNSNYLKGVGNGHKESLIYIDVSMLFFRPLSGVPYAQLLIARNIGRMRKDIRFFYMNKGDYIELSRKNAQILISDLDIDVAVEKIGNDNISNDIPFKRGDVVFFARGLYERASYVVLREAHKNVGYIGCQLIYDFTPILFPHTHQQEKVASYPSALRAMYGMSDFIFYGGNTAQNDGERFQKENNLPVKPSAYIKFGSDVNNTDKEVSDAEKLKVFQKYGIAGEFLLTVGTIEARKNQEVLYEAYLELLQNSDPNDVLPQLVICGHIGWNTEDFRFLLQNDSRIKGKILCFSPTDEERNILYKLCKFTLLPSFYEGYSLTLPESLSNGKLCIASDVPPLREVGNDLIDYANPYDPVEWANKIKFYLTEPKCLQEKEKKIKDKWKKQTWVDCAKSINDIFNELQQKECIYDK